MKKLAILGASGHGKVIADTAFCSGWDAIDLYDDNPKYCTTAHWPFVGTGADLLNNHKQYGGVVIAIGNNSLRLDLAAKFKAHQVSFATVIHPSAIVSSYANIGAGTVVMAGAIINVDAQVGTHCIINTAATLDHDCSVGDGVHISPGAHLAGGVSVDKGAWIGIGACVIQQKHIGKHAIVAAGSAVIANVEAYHTVGGTPAKILHTNEVRRA